MKFTLVFLAVVAIALSALAPAPALAKEPTEAAAAYIAKLAQLPAPSAAGGFSFDGEVFVGAAKMGVITMSAAPVQYAGAPAWKTAMRLDIQGGAFVAEATGIYDAKLKPVQGNQTETTGGQKKQYFWKATGTGVSIEQKGAEAGDTTTPSAVTGLAHDPLFLSDSLTPMILFVRLTNHAAGTYGMDLLVADKGKFVGATLTAGKVGKWSAIDAKLVSGTRADNKTLEAGFDPTSGDLLGVKLAEGPQVFEIRAKGSAPTASKPADFYSEPAKTAQQAAVQAALSFATADFDLLERVTHWDSIYTAMKAANPDAPAEDAAAAKAMFMAQFRVALKPQGPKEMIGPVLESIAPSLEATESEDGSTVVAFGPQFRNLKLTVRKFGTQWYLVKFPDAPR